MALVALTWLKESLSAYIRLTN